MSLSEQLGQDLEAVQATLQSLAEVAVQAGRTCATLKVRLTGRVHELQQPVSPDPRPPALEQTLSRWQLSLSRWDPPLRRLSQIEAGAWEPALEAELKRIQLLQEQLEQAQQSWTACPLVSHLEETNRLLANLEEQSRGQLSQTAQSLYSAHTQLTAAQEIWQQGLTVLAQALAEATQALQLSVEALSQRLENLCEWLQGQLPEQIQADWSNFQSHLQSALGDLSVRFQTPLLQAQQATQERDQHQRDQIELNNHQLQKLKQSWEQEFEHRQALIQEILVTVRSSAEHGPRVKALIEGCQQVHQILQPLRGGS